MKEWLLRWLFHRVEDWWSQSVGSWLSLSPENAWGLWAVILACVALSIYLEQHFQWAAKLSGPVLALLMAMGLSNLGIMPTAAPAYDLIWTYLVPAAIPLLLFRANFFHIIRTTGSMFLAFHISALGTVLGGLAATVLLRGRLEDADKVAGIMTGSYTGGSVNFLALKESFEMPENVTNALLVADNFIMAGMFIALLTLAGTRFMRRWYPHPHSLETDSQQSRSLAAQHWRRKEISLLDIAKALAIAFGIAAVANGLSGWLGARLGAGLWAVLLGNQYVLITGLSLGIATLFHRSLEKVNGAEELGGYLLYVFLFAIGLPADLREVFANMQTMFLVCLIMAVTNLVVTLVLGKLCGLGLEELLISVNATLGGAPSAAAMAIARGWPRLVLPALLVGIWGYVIGTFLGLLVGETFSGK